MRATGLRSFMHEMTGFLGTGIIQERFQMSGINCALNDKLKIIVKTFANCLAHNFRSLGVTLSGPTVLALLSLRNSLQTSCSDTCKNRFALGLDLVFKSGSQITDFFTKIVFVKTVVKFMDNSFVKTVVKFMDNSENEIFIINIIGFVN